MNIRDRVSLEAWLKTQPPEVAVWIAARAAARVQPVWWLMVLRESWARELDLTALPALRGALTSLSATPMHTDTALRNGVASAERAAQPAITAAHSDSASADAARIAIAAHADAHADSAVIASYSISNAANATAATGAIWTSVSEDATTVSSNHDIAAAPLWKDHKNPLESQWASVTEHLRDEPDWSFWLRWYQSLLDGRPMNAEMLAEIALIAPEDWDAGPEKVAKRIADIEWSYSGAQKVELFKATLFDFSFDAMRGVMVAVPMPKDWETLTDKKTLAAFLKDAIDLREDMIILAQAFSAEGMKMQGAGMISTYMAQILDELENSETVGALRVGKLVEWGRILETTSLREDTRRELGALVEPFDQVVRKLKELVRNHFAHTLARFSVLRDIRMEEDAAPWEVLKELRLIVDDVRSGADGVLPPLDGKDVAVLDDVLDSIDRLIRELDQASGEETRSSLKREIDFQMAKIGATVGVYGEKAKSAVNKVGKTADEAMKWERRGRGLWSMLRAIGERLDNSGSG